MRNYPEADTVRITWPNGLIQNEHQTGGQRSFDYQGSAAPVRFLPDDLHLERQAASNSSPMCWVSRRWAQVRATAIISRSITTNTCRFPASAMVQNRWQVRNSHHRGIARGFVSRPDPADRGRSSGEHRDLYERQIQVAAFPGVPAVRRREADPSDRGATMTRQRCACRSCCTKIGKYPDGFRARLQRDVRHCTLSISISATPRRTNRAVLILNGWVDWADGSTFLRRRRRRRKV